ncbi:MAG: alpha/beta hydrolase [Microcystaceae cyanobacterium]
MLAWNWSLIRNILLSSLVTLTLGVISGERSKAIAADTVQLRLGLLQTSVKVKDLETWLETGHPPANVPFSHLLYTRELRQRLKQSFDLDGTIAQSFLDQLWQTQEGDQFLNQLTSAFPYSDPDTLKRALAATLQSEEKINFLTFVRTYPRSQLTVNLSAVINMGLQFQSATLEKQLLRPQLTKAFQDSSSDFSPQFFDPTQTGSEVIHSRSLALVDRQRDRIIPLDIYYSQQTKGSLVVMSHGFAADRQFVAYLARHLASYGFTVVSIEHPGSNIRALVSSAYGMNINEMLPSQEFIDRPRDVKFVLDRLARFNATVPSLKGKFNTTDVTLIGHSFGGYTALALAGATLDLKGLRQFCQKLQPLGRSPADWLQCAAAKLPYAEKQFKDNRIRQVILLNPIVGHLFKDLSQVSVPSLILSNSEDGITPIVSHQLQPFQQLGGEKYLLLGMGGTHMSVTDVSNLDSAVARSTLVEEVMGKEAEPIREVVKGVSLAFISQFTPDAHHYQSFITHDYAQSFSTDSVQLAFTTELPRSLEVWMNTLNQGKTKINQHKVVKRQGFWQNWWQSFRKVPQIMEKPAYCTGQVDDMFNTLLKNYG